MIRSPRREQPNAEVRSHWRRLLPATLATTALLTAGLAATPAVAMPAPGERAAVKCKPLEAHSNARAMAGGRGAHDPNSLSASDAARAQRDLQARLVSSGLTHKAARDLASSNRELIYIDVRVHVIARDDGSGAVPRSMVKAQIKVMNDSYKGRTAPGSAWTPFRFRIKSYDVTKNTDWYEWSLYTDTDNDEAKAALHKGGWDDLNMYIAGLEDGLLGYATFPFDNPPLVDDGVVLLNDSLPGGTAVPYNEGDTATHEVGHWLGLYHTFQDGCVPPGDYVNDTPAQFDGDNIFFCNESDDTCPAPGLDPVHNFMSYGDDPCLDRYTRGQAVRQLQTWQAYRSGAY